jgi:hypothetical protein
LKGSYQGKSTQKGCFTNILDNAEGKREGIFEKDDIDLVYQDGQDAQVYRDALGDQDALGGQDALGDQDVQDARDVQDNQDSQADLDDKDDKDDVANNQLHPRRIRQFQAQYQFLSLIHLENGQYQYFY